MDLDRIIAQKAEADGAYAVAYGLLQVARALHKLGVADAATPMGAIEALSGEVKGVASAIQGLADAVQGDGS